MEDGRQDGRWHVRLQRGRDCPLSELSYLSSLDIVEYKDAVFDNHILNYPSTVIHTNRRLLLEPKKLEMADELLEKLVQGEM